MQEFVNKLREILAPLATKNTEVFFMVGRMMHEYKARHGYNGNMTELGHELSKALNIGEYTGHWFDDASQAHSHFTEAEREALIKHSVCKTDIMALTHMQNKEGWIDNIKTGKLQAPYHIMKSYNAERTRRRKELEHSVTVLVRRAGVLDKQSIVRGLAAIRREVDVDTWCELIEDVESRANRVGILKSLQEKIA